MENNPNPQQEEMQVTPPEAPQLPETEPTPVPEAEPVAQEIPLEEIPGEEPAAQQLPQEEIPVEEPIAREIPLDVNDEPIQEAAAEDPAPEKPAQEAPVEDPTPESPLQEAPAEAPPPPKPIQALAQTLVDSDTLQQIRAAVARKMTGWMKADVAEEPDGPVLEPEAAPLPEASASPAAEPAVELPAEPAVDQEYRDNGSEEFQKMFHAPAREIPIPAHERPARKGRPKRRRGEILFGLPTLAVTVVWLVLILVVGSTLGRMLWTCAADVLAFGRADKVVTITIYQSDDIDDITQKLHKGGLIHYPGLFKLYASLAVDEGEIKPGVWDLNTLYDYHALVAMMSRGTIYEEVEVMIPEGYTCAQIFALLEENKVCTAQDLAAWAASGELNEYWFLEDVERGSENCLEGFLFPDTYKFFKNEEPRITLQRFLDNFNVRFTEEMRGQIATLNETLTAMMRADGKSEEFIANNQFDIRDVVNVASMIEKETAHNDESPLIASVIYNRLFKWGDTPAYLNIDATIVYALNGKTDLTSDDLRVDSPYNTYTNTGMTPGPIANPGLASLKAALNPKESNFYFYVLNPAEGQHKFSTTYEEHQEFIASLE